MKKAVIIQRNKVFLNILLSIFILLSFFLNYLNASAASGLCGLFGGCGNAVGLLPWR